MVCAPALSDSSTRARAFQYFHAGSATPVCAADGTGLIALIARSTSLHAPARSAARAIHAACQSPRRVVVCASPVRLNHVIASTVSSCRALAYASCPAA